MVYKIVQTTTRTNRIVNLSRKYTLVGVLIKGHVTYPIHHDLNWRSVNIDNFVIFSSVEDIRAAATERNLFKNKMSKLVILFACLAAIQVASALQCYSCQNCQGEAKTWDKIPCGTATKPPAGYEAACATIEYKDKVTYKDAVDRVCVNVQKTNGKLVFKCPTIKGEPKKDDCPVCQTDFCNSASGIKFSFVALSSVVLAILAPKFL